MSILSSLTPFVIASKFSLVVIMDGGGDVVKYTEAAETVLRHNVQVRIVGDCYSACTLFADLAREQVCVTRTTKFYIHQATNHPSGTRVPVPYSPDLFAYIGEQPIEGWKLLDYDDLTNFWRTCP